MSKNKLNRFHDIAVDPAPIFAEPVAFRYTVHLDDEFGEKGCYRSVINLLTDATENDSIIFLLNNHGGSMDVILPLINMLEVTQAHTVALCTGSQSSAATIFAMYCDEIVALDFSAMMLHEVQTGHFGTMSNVSRDVDNTKQRNERLINEAYGGFLEPSEIEDLLRGVEIYLSDEEIRARAPKRKAWRDEFLLKKQQMQQDMLSAALEELGVNTNQDLDEEIVVEKPKSRSTRGKK